MRVPGRWQELDQSHFMRRAQAMAEGERVCWLLRQRDPTSDRQIGPKAIQGRAHALGYLISRLESEFMIVPVLGAD
jgi:hypothetical protein